MGDVKHEKIRHVMSGGFKHGTYYRVYVTQVNTSNLESYRSEPSIIRVGDIEAPPVPSLSLDTSTYATGCHAVGDACDVYFKWTTPVCDDLDCYNIFVWKNRPSWYNDRNIYDKDCGGSSDMSFMLSSTENSTSVGGMKSGNVIYIGIQAVDKSKNRSAIAVLRVKVQDNSFLSKPTEPLYAAPHGIWSIRAWTWCPNYDNIMAVEIFRDGEDSIAKLLFIEGATVEFIDILGVQNGLTHYYTYRYITYDGRTSPMSDPSKEVTAEVIDLRYINKAKLEAFNDAWSSSGIAEIETLDKEVRKEAKKTQELAGELEKATKDYEATYNSFKRLVKEFQQLSAQVEQDEKTITTLRTSIDQTAKAVTLKANKTDLDATTQKVNKVIENTLSVNDQSIRSMATQITTLEKQAKDNDTKLTQTKEALQTQITQNADAIKLRATKGEIDSATNQVKNQLVSQITAQADRITTVVSQQGNATSQITQLSNAIQLCATKESINAAVALAVQNGISVATLTANRIVITGEMLFQGNARLVGRLSANYLAVCDQNGKIIWGSDTGVIKPYIWSASQGGVFSISGAHKQYFEFCRQTITPRPPVNFNGQSLVKIAVQLTVEVEMEGNNNPQNAGYGYLGDIKIDNVNATINGTSVGSPLCKLDGYGANTLQTRNNRIDYFPATGGWKYIRAGVYQTNVAFTINYSGSATINQATPFAIYGRIYDAWNGVCIRRMSIINPYWSAECT